MSEISLDNEGDRLGVYSPRSELYVAHIAYSGRSACAVITVALMWCFRLLFALFRSIFFVFFRCTRTCARYLCLLTTWQSSPVCWMMTWMTWDTDCFSFFFHGPTTPDEVNVYCRRVWRLPREGRELVLALYGKGMGETVERPLVSLHVLFNCATALVRRIDVFIAPPPYVPLFLHNSDFRRWKEIGFWPVLSLKKLFQFATKSGHLGLWGFYNQELLLRSRGSTLGEIVIFERKRNIHRG